MVMGSKKRLCSQKLCAADVLDHGPCDRKAVKGAGAAADLIQHQKAVPCGVSKDIRNLGHLHHEGTLTGCQIIRSAHTGKNTVADTDIRLLSRYKAS